MIVDGLCLSELIDNKDNTKVNKPYHLRFVL